MSNMHPRLVPIARMVLFSMAISNPARADACGPEGDGAPSAATDANQVLANIEAAEPTTRSAEPAPTQAASNPETVTHRPASGKKRKVYDANVKRVENAKLKPTAAQNNDLKAFYKNWEKNRARYQTVAAKTGIPAELIAALHFRESSGNFGTYLHQGDKLGKPAVHVPEDIPLFHTWEPAAEHALKMKSSLKTNLNLTENTTDLAALATYAEYYNGLGYYNRGKPSPYVWSGTDQYNRGKYTSDGNYSRLVKDKQLGVIAMVRYIWEMDALNAPGS
jgi:lysozyme family protein